jgi:hypothetical protein
MLCVREVVETDFIHGHLNSMDCYAKLMCRWLGVGDPYLVRTSFLCTLCKGPARVGCASYGLVMVAMWCIKSGARGMPCRVGVL